MISLKSTFFIRFITRGLVSSEAPQSNGATDIQNQMESIFADARVCREASGKSVVKDSDQHVEKTTLLEKRHVEKTSPLEEVQRVKRGGVEEEVGEEEEKGAEEEEERKKREAVLIEQRSSGNKRDNANDVNDAVNDVNDASVKKAARDKSCLRLDPDIASIMSTSRNPQVRCYDY